jgi:hypothetical protein
MHSQAFDMTPEVAQPQVQVRLYEAGCELEQLAGLFAAISDQLDGAYDPHGVGTSAANLARLGFDGIDRTLEKLVGTESACSACWRGRLAIAAALATVPEPRPGAGR